MSPSPSLSPCTVECIFALSGRDFDPDECVGALGLEGASGWRQRRPVLAARGDLPNAAVTIAVGPGPFDSLEEPIQQLLAALGPAREQIVACAARWGLKASVTCLVKVLSERPLYVVSAASMHAMAALGAELSMDLIDLRSNDGA